MKNKKVGLIILDGWGHGANSDSNAVFKAQTPFIDSLYKTVPNAELRTDGEHVGLPNGQMGNSEVGHMNIGAGRVVFQDLVKINKSIESGEFYELESLTSIFNNAAAKGKNVHLIGLVSDGGVHSSIDHVKAICNTALKGDFKNLFIHAFTDGRDTDPEGGKGYLADLEKYCNASTGKIASICGRYYAMDRDLRWERVKKAYDLLVNGKGERFGSVNECLAMSYENGVTDEFIEPALIDGNFEKIKGGDSVICFNFRTDRCREITRALTQENFSEYGMKPLDLDYTTMTKYDASFKGVKVLFEKDNLENTLGEVISKAGLSQVRIAETEKYPHVTFFLSGGREKEFKGETRLMASSPKVATYDLKPDMSAEEVSSKIIEEIKTNTPNYFCLNFANPDMVGHTGVFNAIVKACEATDLEAEKVCKVATDLGYDLLIIADHGNAEKTQNEDGSPHTAHTTNPVPVFYIGSNGLHISNGILADVAPTILSLLEVEAPAEMTGINLITE